MSLYYRKNGRIIKYRLIWGQSLGYPFTGQLWYRGDNSSKLCIQSRTLTASNMHKWSQFGDNKMNVLSLNAETPTGTSS